jgi:hypothetical protein
LEEIRELRLAALGRLAGFTNLKKELHLANRQTSAPSSGCDGRVSSALEVLREVEVLKREDR